MTIIGSRFEHDCVWRYIEVSVSSIEELEQELKKAQKSNETIYVCWMFVNNLTGKVFDVCSIGELCHKYGAYYICDMTAAIGHQNLLKDLDKWCDCCFASAHKFGCEKGQGFMWVSDNFAKHLQSTNSSKSQYGLLHGTVNVPAACAVASGMKCANQYLDDDLNLYNELNRYLRNCLQEKGLEFSLCDGFGTPAINLLHLQGINADALQNYLSTKNVYVGIAASACAEDKDKYRVTNAFYIPDEIARESIRVSYSPDSNKYDINSLVDGIVEFKNKF